MGEMKGCPYCRGSLGTKWRRPNYSQCGGCGLIVRNPLPTQAELDQLYAESWASPEERTGETGGTDQRLARRYAAALVSSLGQNNFSGQRILEFGAGRGALLSALREQGAEVTGIEPYGLDELRRKGFEACASISDLPRDRRFDGVISMDVVEHLPEPWRELEDLYHRLRPGGWMAICTPNPAGLAARTYGRRWRELAKPGHVVFLGSQTLIQIMQEIGLRSIRRLRWRIQYSDNPLRRSLHDILQSCHFGGHVRVIGWKTHSASSD